MSEITSNIEDPVGSEKKPSLNIQDLVNVLQVISTCSQRGAFRADELSSVGGLHDRLYAFLQSTGALNQAKAEEATPESGEI